MSAESSKPSVWRAYRTEYFITLLLAFPVAHYFGAFLDWAEKRPDGLYFADPVLAAFGPYDVTWVLLPLSWLSLVYMFAFSVRRPLMLFEFAQCYTIVMAFKVLTMYLFPFFAPSDIIVLVDPTIDLTIYGGQPRLRDLMFSGHTAQPLVLGLLAGPGRLRWLLWALAPVMGTLVIAQHVHYSIDVLAAPFFVAVGWGMYRWLVKHWRPMSYEIAAAAAER
jgi:hypothetical protein